MPSAQHTVTVNRPLYEVFAFVADKENDPRWRPAVAEMAHVSGEGAGARYRELMKGPAGRPISADVEVTDYVPGKHLAFRTAAGPVRSEGRFDFVEDGGSTRVTFSLEAELQGLKKLIAPIVGKTMRSEVQSLDRLKQILETG